MAFKIGLIGPTNLDKLAKLTQKPVSFFMEKCQEIGRIIAETKAELLVNADKGMIYQTAQAYKKQGGRELTILLPKEPLPWPIGHTEKYSSHGDRIEEAPNWFWANYAVVSQPDICLCLGLSAGTLSELSYIKWDKAFQKGNLQKIIAVRELLRGGCLPPEIELDISEKLIYLEKTAGLKDCLAKFKQAVVYEENS